MEEVALADLYIVSHLEVKEGLAKPVMHDGGLSCIIVEFVPDELSHERLDQQAAAKHGQVVSTKQQRNQQNQATVNLPQPPALQLSICRDDLGSQQVLSAREEDAQNEDVDKTCLHSSPKRQREREITVSGHFCLCSKTWIDFFSLQEKAPCSIFK